MQKKFALGTLGTIVAILVGVSTLPKLWGFVHEAPEAARSFSFDQHGDHNTQNNQVGDNYIGVQPPGRHLSDGDKGKIRELAKQFTIISVRNAADPEAERFADEIWSFIIAEKIHGHRMIFSDWPVIDAPFKLVRMPSDGETDLEIEVGPQAPIVRQTP
jgi:hypothetical protein